MFVISCNSIFLFGASMMLFYWLKGSIPCKNTTIKVSNHFNPDQDRQNVGPDFGQNCLQKGYQQATKQKLLPAGKEFK